MSKQSLIARSGVDEKTRMLREMWEALAGLARVRMGQTFHAKLDWGIRGVFSHV